MRTLQSFGIKLVQGTTVIDKYEKYAAPGADLPEGVITEDVYKRQALTLGCGAVGGSSTSDNITPMNLINIRRVAWGVRELDEIRKQYGVLEADGSGRGREASGAAGRTYESGREASETTRKAAGNGPHDYEFSRTEVEEITRQVLARLMVSER